MYLLKKSKLKKRATFFRGRNDCFMNKPNPKEENTNYVYFGDKNHNGFGYEEFRHEGQTVAYSGQLVKSNNYTGWGYLWSEYDPIYVGSFYKNKLYGAGVRIIHSSNNIKSLSIGFWKLGRMDGPGIIIHKDWTILGNFKIVAKTDEEKSIHIQEDNKSFLKKLVTKKLENIKIDDETNRKICYC